MGIFLTDLADVLRAAGLAVVELPGWKTRGWRGGTTPDGGLLALRGALAHHTATAASRAGNYPSLGLIQNGRPGVAGPLAQLGLGRDGTWYVIAAGRANHSGAVDDQRYFNAYALGVEAEHPGDGTPYPAAQYASYVRGAAAIQSRYGLPAWRGHKEAAIPHGRKIDPRFDMNQFRADVAAVLAGGLPELGGGGSSAPTAPAAPAPAKNYVQRGDTGPMVAELQRLLGITADGIFGPKTEATVRWYQSDRGLNVDGIAGPQTFDALRSGKPSVAKPVGALAVDGVFGPLTKEALQRALGVAVDGVVGPVTIAALQRRVGATADGVWGPKTTKALQRYLGVTVDGIAGPQTYRALQARLNAGTF